MIENREGTGRTKSWDIDIQQILGLREMTRGKGRESKMEGEVFAGSGR